jgi:glucose-1-phosphatase
MNTVDANNLDAVIFDFGGVILNLDYPATDRGLRALLGEAGEVRYTKTHQGRIFDDFETGAIGAEEFYRGIRMAAARDVTDLEINAAWNAMLLDVLPARFEYVKAVASRYRTFLFSNTNPLHKEAFDRTLERHLGAGGFDRLFEKAYYSHSFGMRKPHPETYRTILDKNGLKAARTLMIDDNADNIRGAAEAGLQVYHLTGELLDAVDLQNLLKR